MTPLTALKRRGPALRPRPMPLSTTSSALHGNTLITGGAGFVGSNLAERLLSLGEQVTILDNLSRPGVEQNLDWLRSRYGTRLRVIIADVRNAAAVFDAVAPADAVFHLAAQVAVTTSLADPVADFEVNARGTLNVLEAIRARAHRPPLIVTSTNKVYGALQDLRLHDDGSRWMPADPEIRTRGISERWPLDLHSPYGCSKGAADQYTLDYARAYGLDTTVFRMSCVYGPRQFGTEDQGWVAHFMISALDGRPISIFGDGKQVRDILFVDDLVDAFLLARSRMRPLRGRVFNVGGGAARAVSLLELLDRITEIHGDRPRATFEPGRIGDQRYYVADLSSVTEAIGWQPLTPVQEGLERLYFWLVGERVPASALLATAAEGLAAEQHP